MTCNDFKMQMGKSLEDSTNAEKAAACRHFRECDGCQAVMRQIIDEIADRLSPRELIEALAYGVHEASKHVERMANDPEAAAIIVGGRR